MWRGLSRFGLAIAPRGAGVVSPSAAGRSRLARVAAGIAVASTLGLSLSSAPAVSATPLDDHDAKVQADASTGDVSTSEGHGQGFPHIDDGGLEIPEVTAQSSRLAWARTSGKGTYDVVVVSLNTADGATGVDEATGRSTIGAADARWNSATKGAYRVDFWKFLHATTPNQVCSLSQADDAVEQIVKAATSDGTPRPGKKGLLIVTVVQTACIGAAGYGWLGGSSSLVTASAMRNGGVSVVAHEIGHNFGLNHSGGILCESGNPVYPRNQNPSWPCFHAEYLDGSSIMGGDFANREVGVPAAHLMQLGVIGNSEITEVGGGTGLFDLVPILGTATGSRALSFTTDDGSAYLAEYRAATALSPAGVWLNHYRAQNGSTGAPFTYTYLDGGAWYVESRDGDKLNLARGERFGCWSKDCPPLYQGIPAGTSILLQDGRLLEVLKTGAQARVRLTINGTIRPAAPTITGVRATNRQLVVEFSPPPPNGGSPVTSYEYSLNGGATWAPHSPASLGSPLIISGLTNGTEYAVVLRAVSAAGPGLPSVAVKATPVTTPSAPQITSVIGAPRSLTVAFSPPQSTGGAAVTNYQFSVDGGTTWVPRNPASPDGPLIIKGLSNGASYQVTLRAVNAAGAGAPATTVGGTPVANYVGVPPARLADTREGKPSVDGEGPKGAVAPGQSARIPVVGRGKVPATGVKAVVVNVTATGATDGTYLSVYPTGENVPTASNVNVSPATSVPALVAAKLGKDGSISIFNAKGHTHVAVDVLGWFPEGSDFVPLSPQRLLDTRPQWGADDDYFRPDYPLLAGNVEWLPVAGRLGIPDTAAAVFANVTAAGASEGTYVTAFPAAGTPPNASTVNVAAGQTIANLTLSPLNSLGYLGLYNHAGLVDLVVDAFGWFPKDSDYVALTPARFADTRLDQSTVDNKGPKGMAGPGETVLVPIAGRNGLPASGIGSVAVNITATGPTAGTFLTAWPTGEPRPNASNVNPAAGQTVPNMAIVKVGAGGSISLFNEKGETHVIVDVLGWFPD